MASEEGSLPEGWRLQRDRLEGRRWRESSDGNRSLRARREGVSRARAERPAYQLGRVSIAPSASWLMCPSVFAECHANSCGKFEVGCGLVAALILTAVGGLIGAMEHIHPLDRQECLGRFGRRMKLLLRRPAHV